MPRNVYFSQGAKSEQNLVEDLVVEALKIYGFDLYYLPRNLVSRDLILNEDIESKFDAAYQIEMYIENTDGFAGDGIFMSKFGLQIREQATFVVSRRQWEKLVGLWNNGIISTRPAEGDVLYFPLTKSYFEIKFVEHQQPFYQLTNVPTYKLQCELFEYNNEEVTTGNRDVDQLERSFSTETWMDIANGTVKFTEGEKVKQVLIPATETTAAVEIYGKVLHYYWDDANSVLKVAVGELSSNSGRYQTFRDTTGAGDQLVSMSTIAAWDITRVYTISDADVNLTFVNNDQQAQNRDFEKEGNAVIDFSERNPFGDVNFVDSGSPIPALVVLTSDTVLITGDSSTVTTDNQ